MVLTKNSGQNFLVKNQDEEPKTKTGRLKINQERNRNRNSCFNNFLVSAGRFRFLLSTNAWVDAMTLIKTNTIVTPIKLPFSTLETNFKHS